MKKRHTDTPEESEDVADDTTHPGTIFSECSKACELMEALASFACTLLEGEAFKENFEKALQRFKDMQAESAPGSV